jgi:hypothetical protein
MGNIIATIPKNARERVQIELTEFNGHNLLAIRVFADNGAKWVPTRKGITVRAGMLPDLAAALTAAEREAREAGLLT